ncbi:hypothetical protein [Klenkia sesuvii]|uniref:hypothetical protein n=1 Tax=Klenkia sesuvii TaxID=3103137 RepID=UPI00300FBD1A
MALDAGPYRVTAFPPSSGYASEADSGETSLVVPDDGRLIPLTVNLTAAELPDGSFIETPDGDVTGSPVVNWAQPTVFHTKGCAQGSGILTVRETGSGQTRSVPLTENPRGSGAYEGQIPALHPLHGSADVSYSISCPNSSAPRLVPGGGPDTGGTPVTFRVATDSPVVRVEFAGVPGTDLRRDGSAYTVTSPAGRGDAGVVGILADGSRVPLGTFTFMAPPRVSPTDCTTDGLVTVNGSGLDDRTVVLFGTEPARIVSVDSPSQLTVAAPCPALTPSTGPSTVPVTVVPRRGYGVTTSVVTGGGHTPQGWDYNAGIDVDPILDAIDMTAIADSLIQLNFDLVDCGAGDVACKVTASRAFGLTLVAAGLDKATDAVSEIPGNFTESQKFRLMLLKAMMAYAQIGILLAFNPVAAAAIITAASLGLFLAVVWTAYGDEITGHFGMLIDPSGTVVDVNGTPVAGAVTTVLRRDADGVYVPLPADSPLIDPHVNPQTTGADGAFAWMVGAGLYAVETSSDECLDPDTGRPAVVRGGPYVIPPPALNIILRLPCEISAPPTPTVTGVSPGLTTDAPGIPVTLSGSGLGGATKVTVGGQDVAFEILSPYTITFTTPLLSGDSDVVVTTPGGTSAINETSTLRVIPSSELFPALAPSTTTLSSESTASGVRLVASVTSDDGTPEGRVVFLDGDDELGSSQLVDGRAEITVPAAPSTVVARYSGSSRHLSSSDEAGVGTPSSGTTTPVPTTTSTAAPSTTSASTTPPTTTAPTTSDVSTAPGLSTATTSGPSSTPPATGSSPTTTAGGSSPTTGGATAGGSSPGAPASTPAATSSPGADPGGTASSAAGAPRSTTSPDTSAGHHLATTGTPVGALALLSAVLLGMGAIAGLVSRGGRPRRTVARAGPSRRRAPRRG